jgi:hypothetical protein
MLFKIPYDVKLYQSPHHDTKPRVESTGHVDWEFDEEQMALLNKEMGNPRMKYTKWFLDSITDYLGRYVKERLEREHRMGDYAPNATSRVRTFVLVKPTKVTLKGTPATWQKQKETIYFTGNVEFCVTADIQA